MQFMVNWIFRKKNLLENIFCFSLRILNYWCSITILWNFQKFWTKRIHWKPASSLPTLLNSSCFAAVSTMEIKWKHSNFLKPLFCEYIVMTNGFTLTHLCLASHERDIGKQCRPRSDAAECSIWSGSVLFALDIAGIILAPDFCERKNPTWTKTVRDFQIQWDLFFARSDKLSEIFLFFFSCKGQILYQNCMYK